MSRRPTERGGWLTAADLWRERCAESADSPFLWFEDQRWNYAEFDTWTNSLAQILSAHGIEQGNRVAFILPNCAQGVRLILAAAKIGCVLVPVMANLTRQEISHVIRSSGPGAIIGTARYTHGRAELTAAGFRDGVALDGDGPEDALVLLKARERQVPFHNDPDDPFAAAFILYTSGSTSASKGAVIPSAGLVTTGTAWGRRIGLGPGARILCVLPLVHAGPILMQLGGVISTGAEMVLARRFSASQFWGLVNRTRSTHAVLPAAITSILLTASPAPGDADNRLQMIGTDRYSPDFCQRFGVQARTMWAMTETSAMGCMSETAEVPGDGFIGRPLPSDARVEIRAADGLTPAGPGMTGELWFRHPHVMLRYEKDLEQTRLVLVNGWIRTGDLGHRDAAGRFYFDGRVKNVIKRSGENVSAEEVERVLAAHRDVVESVVVGVHDPIRLEEVYGWVVERPGAGLDPEELFRWCETNGMSRWKIPRYLRIVRSPLVRIESGKIDRRHITQMSHVDQAHDFGAARTRLNQDEFSRGRPAGPSARRGYTSEQ